MHAASQPAPFFLFLSFSSHLRSPFRVAEVEGSEREGGAGGLERAKQQRPTDVDGPLRFISGHAG